MSGKAGSQERFLFYRRFRFYRFETLESEFVTVACEFWRRHLKLIAPRWQDIWSFIYIERLHGRLKFLEGEPSGKTSPSELKVSPFSADIDPCRCSSRDYASQP